MHKEYIENNDYIIVINENGDTNFYENTYRVRELLKTENSISELEEKKNDIDEEIEDVSRVLKSKLGIILSPIINMGIRCLSIVFLFYFIKFSIAYHLISFAMVYFILADAFIVYSLAIILLGIISGVKNIHKDIKNRYIMEELTNILDEIEKELTKQKEKRDILKKNIEAKKIENTKIDSSKKFDKIDADIEAYYTSTNDENSLFDKIFDYVVGDLEDEEIETQKIFKKEKH